MPRSDIRQTNKETANVDIDIELHVPSTMNEIELAELVDELTNEPQSLHLANNLTETQAAIANQELKRRGVASRIRVCTIDELLDVANELFGEPAPE